MPMLAAVKKRLTPLDSSFLRVESPSAHMHVAWVGLYAIDPARERPALNALRAKVGARLRHLPRFRQRLAFPPLRMGEPFWVDDPDFHVSAHVTELCRPDEPISLARFRKLTDAILSEPLDRDRPLWQIYLVPRLDDGRAGLVCKLHHAMVDGKSAVEVALLLFDSSPDTEQEAPDAWSPPGPPNGARLALDSVVAGATESLRAVRGIARAAGPGGASSLAGTLRRAALAVEMDLLRPAPPSYLNVPIGPGRTLVCHSAAMSDVTRARNRTPATVNDVCLAAVSGALRELALASVRPPRQLKVMVPVSVRDESQRRDMGNRISFTFIDLPVHLRSPHERLEHIHRSTSAFKSSGRASGTELVLGAVGALPEPLKDVAARMVASPRTYNLTVSNIPGPSAPVYMLGAELTEAYPVVPLADDHTLSIGIFGYCERLHFGIYADPEALPGVTKLPAALNSAILSLAGASRRRARDHRSHGPDAGERASTGGSRTRAGRPPGKPAPSAAPRARRRVDEAGPNIGQRAKDEPRASA
jgi:diacylglycerol O-acyltransferase